MPESVSDLPFALWLSIGGIGFLLLFILFALSRLRARLLWIQRALLAMESAQATREVRASPEDHPGLDQRKSANRVQKRLFRQFLEEDPARREMSKKEQFSAFRKWRSERGLNWSGADQPDPAGTSGAGADEKFRPS